jgi:hypothetical protein
VTAVDPSDLIAKLRNPRYDPFGFRLRDEAASALESQLAENTELRAVIEQAMREPHADTCGSMLNEIYPCSCHVAILASVVPVSPEKKAGN